MKKLQLVCFILSCFSCMIAYGQKENAHWAFGYGAGLDFSSGTAVPFKTGINSTEGCAAVSSRTTGALLFYSDGDTVWNKNNQPMPHGDSLLGNIWWLTASGNSGYPLGKNPGKQDNTTSQGVCIVPVIGHPQQYYLFSLQPQGGGVVSQLTNGVLFYSVIDMSLDGGLGDVIASKKNIPVDSFLGESMIAIPGSNCNDIWLIVHASDTGLVKAYHITQNGIDPNPVISYMGPDIDGKGSFGACKYAVSPDGTMLAMTSSNVLFYALPSFFFAPNSSPNGALVCKFDAATGKISDSIVLHSNLKNPGEFMDNDICFSPDGKKLYLSLSARAPGDINFQDTLWQYDLSNLTQAAVVSSKTFISTTSVSNEGHSVQRRGDKLYVISPSDYATLDLINKPDEKGSACTYQKSAIALSAGAEAGYALPTQVVYPLGIDTAFNRIDTLICHGDINNGIKLSAPTDSSNLYAYKWDDGSTNNIRSITTKGTYWVNYSNTCHYQTDTFVIKGLDPDPVINISKFDLSTTMPYKTYQWFLNKILIPGATNRVYTVSQNGDYTVVVSTEEGCIDTSAPYKVTNVTGINEANALTVKIKIYPNPAHDVIYINAPVKVNATLTGVEGKVIKQVNDASVIPVDELASGVYLLRITNQDGGLIKVEKFIKAE